MNVVVNPAVFADVIGSSHTDSSRPFLQTMDGSAPSPGYFPFGWSDPPHPGPVVWSVCGSWMPGVRLWSHNTTQPLGGWGDMGRAMVGEPASLCPSAPDTCVQMPIPPRHPGTNTYLPHPWYNGWFLCMGKG